MSSGQLSKRFFFGSNNHSIYLTTQAQHDFFYGIPGRQKQMISLAKAQVAAQFETAKAIEQNNFHVAQEIRQFSANMESAIQRLGDDIVYAIDQLEYSLVCEFREVRWLLAQQGKLLEEIIEILRKRRKVEANELLQQAIANLANGFYSEAKDRLIRALVFDNTDFQVHRNLGYIYLHEDNGDKAIEHFYKATSFSPSNRARFEAKGDLSRTYYATGDYQKAAQYEDDLLKMTIQNPDMATNDEIARCWYHYGVYNGLAGKSTNCLNGLEKAIDLFSRYFALASIDRDLENVRSKVNILLESKIKIASERASSEFSKLSLRQSKLKIPNVSNLKDTLDQIFRNYKIAEKKIHSASYTDLLDIEMNCQILKNAVDLFEKQVKLHVDISSLESLLQTDESRLNDLKMQKQSQIEKLTNREHKKAK